MINVLIVEDSPVVREFLVHVLSADPEIRVVGTAADGEEAVAVVREKKPDVVTMDIHMPKMDGFEATRQIMETYPVPIIIVSGSSTIGEVSTAFGALDMGALTVIPRPNGIGHAEHEATARALVQIVKLMSEVKVVKRWARHRAATAVPPTSIAPPVGIERVLARVGLVAIGASTGGPQALQGVLSGLPKDFPVPVLIVQHIAVGFLPGLVDWLSRSCALPVQIARHGESIQPGQVCIAPDDAQIAVRHKGIIVLTKDPPEHGHRPSVSHLFDSVAEVYGRNAIGVLLTGMGKDGAEALKRMKDRNAVTIVQDAETSVVHGMPGEAIRLGAATYVLTPAQIAAALSGLANHR